jgi:hypothetical protein
LYIEEWQKQAAKAHSRLPLPVPAPHPDWQPLSLGSIAIATNLQQAREVAAKALHVPQRPGLYSHAPYMEAAGLSQQVSTNVLCEPIVAGLHGRRW